MTHRTPKTHRDPPEPRLLDDGYLVEPEPPERVPWQGWERPVAHPAAIHAAWFGLGVCVGVVLLALLILGRVAIDGAGS